MEFDRRLGPPGFVLTVCAGSPSRSRVLFPVFRLIAEKDAAAGLCSSVRARYNRSDGWQKNGRTCGR